MLLLGQVEEFLRTTRTMFDPVPLSPREPLRTVLVTGGVSVRSKLISLWWRSAEPLPCVVVKFPRSPGVNLRLEAEYAALCMLQAHVPSGPVQVPRPLGSTLRSGLRIAAESAVHGRTLRAAICEYPDRTWRSLSSLRPFVRWLAALHAQSSRPATPQEVERLVLAPLRDAARTFGDLSAAEQAALALLRQRAADLAADAVLPLVFAHGDVDTSNVIVDPVRRFAGLIDWESAGMGLPLQDLVYFLGRYAYETHSAGLPDQLRGFRLIFFEHSQAGGVLGPHLAATWFDQYRRAIDLAPAWLPVLFALTWIQHARNERETLLSLRDDGQMLHGKPAAMTTTNVDASMLARGHFRSQLRYCLEHLEHCAALSHLLSGTP